MSNEPVSVFRPDVMAGKVVFVTGGATGIGKEIARVFGRHGARVAIASRKADNLAAAQAELSAEGIECHIDTFDVRDAVAVERVVAGVIDRPASVGQTYDIGGSEALSGQALADILSAPVGRPLTYQALDLDQFAAGLNGAFGAPTGDDVADIYRHLSERPDALARDTSPWTEIGVEPESAAAWAARQTWRLA